MNILMGLGVVLVICLILFLAIRPLSERDKEILKYLMKQNDIRENNRAKSHKESISTKTTSVKYHTTNNKLSSESSENGGDV